MIHLLGPVLLTAALAGTGVYGLLARRNAVLVLIGAELLLNAAGVLLVTASTLPAGGLSALITGRQVGVSGVMITHDPLISGQVMTIFLVTIAAAEIGLALAVILLLYRRRATTDLTAVRELGEASPSYGQVPVVLPRPAGWTVPGAARAGGAGGAGRAAGNPGAPAGNGHLPADGPGAGTASSMAGPAAGATGTANGTSGRSVPATARPGDAS